MMASLLLTVIPPILVASSIADEIDDKTSAYLWSRALPRWSIVLGKFLAAWLFYLAMLVPTAAGPVVFHWYHGFDVPPVLVPFMGKEVIG